MVNGEMMKEVGGPTKVYEAREGWIHRRRRVAPWCGERGLPATPRHSFAPTVAIRLKKKEKNDQQVVWRDPLASSSPFVKETTKDECVRACE